MKTNSKYIQFIMCLGIFLSSLGISAQEKGIFSEEYYVQKEDTLKYRMLLPKNFVESKQYPLVLFLHGAGERGSDNKKQLVNGSSLFLNEKHRDSFPAIVIFPQCPQQDYWSKLEADRSTRPITYKYKYDEAPTTAMAMTMGLMDEMVSKSYIKTAEVYVMGLSMGGYGDF